MHTQDNSSWTIGQKFPSTCSESGSLFSAVFKEMFWGYFYFGQFMVCILPSTFSESGQLVFLFYGNFLVEISLELHLPST